MKLIPRRLYTQVALLVSLLLLLAMVSYGGFMAKRQADILAATHESEALALARHIANSASHHYLVGDYAAIDELLKRTCEMPDIVRVQAIETSGLVLSDMADDAGGRPQNQLSGLAGVTPPQGRTSVLVREGGAGLVVWEPIVAGEVLGWLKITFDHEEIRRMQRAFWEGTAALTLFWTLSSIFVILLLIRYPVKAVRRVSEFAQNIVRLKGQELPVERTSLEVEQLGESLNLASRQIHSAEQALIAERERLWVTLDSIADAVLATDIQGRVVYMNRVAETLVGHPLSAVFGRLFMEICPLSFPQAEGNPLERILKGVERGKATASECTLARGAGDVKILAMTVTPTGEEDGMVVGAVVVLLDMTERIRSEEERDALEDRLRQAQKMEALGTLAGGIAHDFNNILSPILGYAEMAQMVGPTSSALPGFLEQISKAGERARDLVQQILSFSRQTEQEKRPLQVHLVVREALKLLRASIPSSIAIRERIETDGYILADPTEIHQVVMNLCTNAAHAMKMRGGALTVSLEEKEIVDADVALLRELQPGRFILMTVGDTGHGMSQETMKKIFDPYFTTKPKGEGTGLGLFVVIGIVKRHGGHVAVYSEPGHGTTFHVYFPMIPREVAGSYKPDPGLIKQGTERVLVVDDERALTMMLQEMLSRLGYQVTSFTSSAEAWEEFQKRPDEFDAVVTDMTMPGMSGLDLSRQILRLRPKTPIILCTGFSQMVDDLKVRAAGIRGFINKPVLLKDLARALREAIETPPEGTKV